MSSLESWGLSVTNPFEDPWHRLRTCAVPIKILEITNRKTGVPSLTSTPHGY